MVTDWTCCSIKKLYQMHNLDFRVRAWKLERYCEIDRNRQDYCRQIKDQTVGVAIDLGWVIKQMLNKLSPSDMFCLY